MLERSNFSGGPCHLPYALGKPIENDVFYCHAMEGMKACTLVSDPTKIRHALRFHACRFGLRSVITHYSLLTNILLLP